MTDPNEDALIAARAVVAARYNARYHVNAIMAGAWDKGSLVQNALRDILVHPGNTEGDE
jgi:hypothetical protein